MDTWDKGGEYRDRVLADPAITEVLSKEEIDRAFSLDQSLRHIDAIFDRTLERCGAPSSEASKS
jgi:adenylosuccinate lyase